MNMKTLRLKIFLLIFIVSFYGCSVFEFSPYEISLDTDKSDLTKKNISRILDINTNESDSFKIALIADSHSSYGELKKAIVNINEDKDILFVIHLGDLTDMGLKNEYQWCNDLLEELSVPYLTVIGNHDCLSNGIDIYKNMYGDLNYSFVLNNVKFIILNDNIWEFENNVPDYNWLENELSDNSSFNNVFVIAHIPPFNKQFNDDNEKEYKNMMSQNSVSISIHGHNHFFYYDRYYNDSIPYLLVNKIGNREYCTMKIDEDSLKIKRIFF